MNVYSRSRLLMLCLASVLVSQQGMAAGELHLLFHMGMGAQGKFHVGGTVQNKGDAPVKMGYVVILPVSGTCAPMAPLTGTFGELKPGQKEGFTIPVDGRLSGYRVGSVAAFDDEGFALKVVDDTQKIIQAREPEERKKCDTRREQGANRDVK